MKDLIKLSALMPFMVALLAGCIEIEEDEDDENNASREDIVGVWDFSTDEAGGLRDEYYIHVSSDGTVTVYDYYGDSYDDQGNCYSVSIIGSSAFDSSDNNFDWNLHYGGATSSDQFTVTVSGDVLTVAGSERHSRLDLQVSDLTPEC